MRNVDKIMDEVASGKGIRAAGADLLRAYRIRNILLAIVGAEAIVFIALRTWNVV
jgi:hypothetical protein